MKCPLECAVVVLIEQQVLQTLFGSTQVSMLVELKAGMI